MITYLAVNTLNGKFYIGSTTNFENRQYSHLHKKHNYPFQNALQKNPSCFIWEVYEDEHEEPVLEQVLLDIWFGTEQCYNLNPVADRPPVLEKHSAETKAKMVKTRNEPGYGNKVRAWIQEKRQDPDFCESHREATLKGCTTPEARKKNSEQGLRRWKDESYRQRMKEAHQGKGLPWWVKENGITTRSQTSPGAEWQRGRKWKPC